MKLKSRIMLSKDSIEGFIDQKVPKISVIVPVYNVEKYIQRCIDSILNQSFQDFEIIIVNDASPDHSMEIVQKCYGNHPKIRLLENEKNIGLGPTRNHGMALARGEYIAFVDSDDYVEHNYLKMLYQTAIREDADVVSCGYMTVDDNGYIQRYYHIPIILNGGVETLNELISRQLMVAVWLKLYRRSFLEKNRVFFRPILGEDVLFHFMITYYCEKFVAIPDPLYFYFQSSQSITRGNYNLKWIDTFCEILGHVEKFVRKISEKDITVDDMFIKRIYQYFFTPCFSDTFSESFQESEFADKVLEAKLRQYFPESHRYMSLLIYELIEAKKTINRQNQHIRVLETSTPILAQANRRRELASSMLRMNRQEWDVFVDSKVYEVYWDFIHKISWQEQLLPQEDKAYRELRQYLSENREIWQLHCIYFASLLYEKPWNIAFLPDIKKLPKSLANNYLEYVSCMEMTQGDPSSERHTEFNQKLRESIISLIF